jgi:hypothetical protein
MIEKPLEEEKQEFSTNKRLAESFESKEENSEELEKGK